MCTCAMSGFIKHLFTVIFRSEKERTGGGMKRDSREGAFFLETYLDRRMQQWFSVGGP